MTTEAEVHDAIEELLAKGILARWWCERCEDWVLYRRIDIEPGPDVRIVASDAESRAKHNAERHP